MKYNLKNLIEDCKNPKYWRDEIVEKLEGFEAELREKTKAFAEKYVEGNFDKAFSLGVRTIIREILGE